MASIPQNHFDENDLIDCVQRFFSKHHVGKLLARCTGKMFSSLMTAFLIVPAARKQNWHQRFLTTLTCISKKVFGCLP